MEVYGYPQFGLQATVCLLTDVKNGPEIRKKILEAATCQVEVGEALRDAVNFAFVDARLVSGSRLCCGSLPLNGTFCEDYEHLASTNRDLLCSVGSEPGIFADKNCPLGNPLGTQPEQ